MTARRKANMIAAGSPIFSRQTKIVRITSGTMGTGCTLKGIVAVHGTTAGITGGNVYITIDTSGTGSKINA